jgi:hypothetical protein
MDCEKELTTRLQEHLPRDKMGLRHIVEQQKVSFMFIISRSFNKGQYQLLLPT